MRSAKPDINAGLQYLGTQGVNHALIEAGPGIVTSILAADAVDRIYWTQSDHILGANAIAAVDNLVLSWQTRSNSSTKEILPVRITGLIGDDR